MTNGSPSSTTWRFRSARRPSGTPSRPPCRRGPCGFALRTARSLEHSHRFQLVDPRMRRARRSWPRPRGRARPCAARGRARARRARSRIGVRMWPNGPSSGWSSVHQRAARAQLRIALDQILACPAPRRRRCPSCCRCSTAAMFRARGAPGGERSVARRRVGASSARLRELRPFVAVWKVIATQRSSPAPGYTPWWNTAGSALPGRVRRSRRGAKCGAHLLHADLVHRGIDVAAAPAVACALLRGAAVHAPPSRTARSRRHTARRRESPGRRPASRSGRCGPRARRRCRRRPIPAPAARSGRRRCPRP